MSRPVRVLTCCALTAGLLAGAPVPAVAGAVEARIPVAAATPLLAQKCRKPFRKDLKDLRQEGARVWEYYHVHRRAEQVLYDQLRWLLADPDAQDTIPQLQAGAAQFLEATRPVVTDQRAASSTQVNRFEARYAVRRCLRADGRKVLRDGVRSWRAGLKDIFTAHGRLFAMNMAVQTAQADQAGQYLQDAELEMATVEGNIDRAEARFDVLLGR